MKYIVTFMKKSGKVKGRVGCNSKKTVDYLLKTWREDETKKGVCLITNTETKEEEFYKK